MNKDMAILFENSEYVILTWEKYDGAKYILMGSNDCFNYEKIVESNNNKIKIFKNIFNKFLDIKVFYVIRSLGAKDVVLGSSNSYLPKTMEYNGLFIKFLKSYNGITLSIQSNDIYDKYYVYEKVNDEFVLLMESEDFQITSNKFTEGNIYYVEGFLKEGNDFVLKGVSDKKTCNFTQKVKGKNSISVIVPIYNSERFLSRCIDSILLSSFKDLEIILIDDGSKDKSPEIADWYCNNYGDFITVIHKENEGVSYARNKGIELASSEYIAFVDNDDIVHPNMYYNLYSLASSNDLDIVIGKTIIRDKPYDYSVCLSIDNDDKYLIYDFDKMFWEKNHLSFNNIFFVAVWNKIIRTSIVKEHPFALTNHYEDTCFTRTIYSYIDKFGFSCNSYYVWDKRIQGTVGTATNNYSSSPTDPLSLHKKFRDATFYCVENGNPKRIDYLVYDSIKEAYNYMKGNGFLNNNPDICDVYNDEIVRVCKKYKALNNKFLKDDKEVFDYVKKIFSFKTEL